MLCFYFQEFAPRWSQAVSPMEPGSAPALCASLANVTPSTQLHLGQVQTSLASLTCLHLDIVQVILTLYSTYDTVTSLSTSAA